MATPASTKCTRCGHPIPRKQTMWIAVTLKFQRPFCDTCYIKWFDVRDEVVIKAFKAYIGED